MDPYQILGVPRDCSRDEAKDAFRAKSWDAHPDHGGDEADFIRLCEAYKAILAELDRFPRRAAAKSVGRRSRSRNRNRGQRQRRKSSPAPRPPDPNWEPELVISDRPPPSDRPPRPPDPSWEPELVMLGEPPAEAGQPAANGSPGNLTFAPEWLREIADRGIRTRRPPRPSQAASQALWAVLGLLASAVACWVVWKTFEP